MKMDPGTYKLFIAIPAPPVIKVLLQQLRAMNSELTGVRWVPEANLHLTVYFLGNVQVVNIPFIQSVMENSLENLPAFQFRFQKVTLEGGKPAKPSMVWARFERNDHFTKLANEIGKQVTAVIPAPSKFTEPIPHITLARIKSGALPDVSVSADCEINFTGYELWRSISIPGGVRYEAL